MIGVDLQATGKLPKYKKKLENIAKFLYWCSYVSTLFGAVLSHYF
jgi:hypothetical protein